MKRVASIFLLALFIFNWAGYRLFTTYMEQEAGTRLESQLDNNKFDESQLISIKIPATHLSFYALSKSFQRVDGKVEIKGITYKYVKSRLYNDSLEFLCIPDQAFMTLQTAKDAFFTLVNDLKHNGQEKKTDSHPGTPKSFAVDYYTINDLLIAGGPHCSVAKKYFHYTTVISNRYSFTAEHPPDPVA